VFVIKALSLSIHPIIRDGRMVCVPSQAMPGQAKLSDGFGGMRLNCSGAPWSGGQQAAQGVGRDRLLFAVASQGLD